MNDRNLDQLLDAWLDLGPDVAPDRVHSAIALEVRTTRQAARWSQWAAERFSPMNALAKLAVAAAAVVVVAVVGINLLSPSGGVGGSGPSVSPSPSAMTSAVASATPRPTRAPRPSGLNPFRADFTTGSHSLDVDGIPFSFNVPARNWEPFGSLSRNSIDVGHYLITKNTAGPQGAEAMILWASFPDRAATDLCAPLLNPLVGPSVADLAAAVSTAPGTQLVSGPSDVSVGGRVAKHVVLTVRQELSCDPGFFYNWDAPQLGAMWQTTDVGDTISVWIVDVDGARFFIEGETHTDAGLAVEQEIQQIVDSIRFE